MVQPEMLGKAILLLGIILAGSGTVIYLSEPPKGSQNSFCDGSYCIVKSPICCCKTLHGILFDTGWALTVAGSIILLSRRIRRHTQG